MPALRAGIYHLGKDEGALCLMPLTAIARMRCRRAGRPHRRARQPVRRARTIRFDVSEAEHAEVADAAGRAGLTYGAFAAEATLAARGTMIAPDALLREVLSRFDTAICQVRKIGTNLNQAVRALNSTGQQTGDLLPYAARSDRRTTRLEVIAEELRSRLVAAIRVRGSRGAQSGPRPAGAGAAGPRTGGPSAGSGPRGPRSGFPVG